MVSMIPTVLERVSQGNLVGYDIFSRLLKDRIIFVGGYEGTVTTDSANLIIAQLLFLEAEDPEKEINLYINSPGGMVTAGLAVYDTMQYIRCPITTICMGMAMSFGAVLVCASSCPHHDSPAADFRRRHLGASDRNRDRSQGNRRHQTSPERDHRQAH